MRLWHDCSGCLGAQPRHTLDSFIRKISLGGSRVRLWHDYSGCLGAQPRHTVDSFIRKISRAEDGFDSGMIVVVVCLESPR